MTFPRAGSIPTAQRGRASPPLSRALLSRTTVSQVPHAPPRSGVNFPLQTNSGQPRHLLA